MHTETTSVGMGAAKSKVGMAAMAMPEFRHMTTSFSFNQTLGISVIITLVQS